MCVCAACCCCCCCQTSDEQVVKPVVSVYPAASRAHLEGKSSLLCLASAMFPPLVRFSWKRQEENGPLLPAEGEQLELRESGRTAAILLIRQKEIGTYKYRCSVQHQGGTVEAQTQQGNEGLVTVFSSDSASCQREQRSRGLTFLTDTPNISLLFSFRGFLLSSRDFPVQGEAALCAVHSADSEESGVLLWTLSADDPQKQGTVHQLHTC